MERRLFTIALLFFVAVSCAGPIVQFRRKDLPDYGVALFVPAEWSLRRGDFFHATASGKIPNGQNGTMDYRGIEKVKKDFQSRALYATGWYEAVSRNYPGWKFETRSTSPQDPEGTFEFEGTYRQGAVIYRKIGRLRFRGDRVHAFYYTAPDDDFESSRKFFEDMDGRHRYFQPRS